jgi:hypothetical protein
MRELHGHNPAETEIDFDNIELHIAPRGRQGARGRSRSASPGRRQTYHQVTQMGGMAPETSEAQEGPPRYGSGSRIGGRGRGYHFETQKFPLGRGGGTYRNATNTNRPEALFPGAFRDIINMRTAGANKPTIKTQANTRIPITPPGGHNTTGQDIKQDPKSQNTSTESATKVHGPTDNKGKNMNRTPPRNIVQTGDPKYKQPRGGTSPNNNANDKKSKTNKTPGSGVNRSLFNESQRMEIEETPEEDEQAGHTFNPYQQQ